MRRTEAKVGDIIQIIHMKDEHKYDRAVGRVIQTDAAGQIHGTWGGCALIPGEDVFMIIGTVGEVRPGHFLLWENADLLSKEERKQILRGYADNNFENPEDGVAWYTDMENFPNKADNFLEDYCNKVFVKDFGNTGEWHKAPWADCEMIVEGEVEGKYYSHTPLAPTRFVNFRSALLSCLEEFNMVYEDDNGNLCVDAYHEHGCNYFKIIVADTRAPLHYCHEVIGWDGHLPHKDKR